MVERGNDVPPEWSDLRDRIVSYKKELSDLGIRDYQVQGLLREGWSSSRSSAPDSILRESRLLYHIVHLVMVLLLAAVPAAFLNVPVGLLARLYSERRRRRALSQSKVKIHGRDVVMSERVMFCIMLVPTLWIVYGLLLVFFTDLDGPTLALCIISMPAFSYVGVVAAEAGMADWKKDLRPYVMRLFPSSRRRLAALPEIRRALRADVRSFVAEVGPSLGGLYYDKDLDWKDRIKVTRKASAVQLAAMVENADVGSEGKKSR